MKRAATVVLAALVLAACGSEEDDADTQPQTTAETVAPSPDSALFDVDEVGFTFEYPPDFVLEKPAGVLGQVSLRRGAFFNAIKVREAADRELSPDRYLDDFRRDFERRVDDVEKRVERIGDLEAGVLQFADSHQQKGDRIDFTSTSYFFTGAGRTWQVECVWEDEHEDEMAPACRAALESVQFEKGA